MSIVETYATPSRRYYLKLSKDKIARKIQDLQRALGFPWTAISDLTQKPKGELVDMAMVLHRQMPNDEECGSRQPTIDERIAGNGFRNLQDWAHNAAQNAGWWGGIDPIEDVHVVPAKLCLIHSEISEAMEGHRKGLMDDKLPHRSMLEVELADVVIRVGDLAGRLGLDVGGAITEKMAYNRNRADHKPENRAKKGGKGY
jgi:NTP pyrophosphatase (non-canonical NTP hydrolase)